MIRIRCGELDVWCLGGADKQGGGDGPAVVLCHGFGAPGDDLVGLGRAIPLGREVRWFFPEALLSLDMGFAVGRAWWPIDMMRLQEAMMRGEMRNLRDETPDGLARAREALEGTLGALESRFGVKRDRTLLGGFSQGAMLTTEVALHAADPFAGLVVFSGTLLSESRWKEAAAKTGPSIHAIVTHGRRDPILPFEGAEALRDLLTGAGARVAFVPHGGAHEIPQVAAEALVKLAQDRLGVASGAEFG